MGLDEEMSMFCELVKDITSSSHGKPGNTQDDLEKETEELDTKIQEILNSIQNQKFTVEREQEKMREKRDRMRIELEEERKRLVGSRVELEQLENKNENNLRALQEKEKELARTKASVDEMLGNIPKLTEKKQLYYSVSRITFDKTAKPNTVRGFVMNPRKEDVNLFDFNYATPGITKQFVRNYLWDVIAAGVNPVWDTL